MTWYADQSEALFFSKRKLAVAIPLE